MDLENDYPPAVSSASWHALSGATTYVTTSDSNPSSGNEGDDFSFSFTIMDTKHLATRSKICPTD